MTDLTPEQIEFHLDYLKSKLSCKHRMNMFTTNYDVYKENGFTHSQFNEINFGYLSGINAEHYTNKKFSVDQMTDIRACMQEALKKYEK